MINDIVFEGIVVREPWKYTDDLFFRLAGYRDTDLPGKPLDSDRDQADYVNVRVMGGANGLMQIRRGMRLRIHGYLQSRDIRESLADFVDKAHKSGSQVEVNLAEGRPEQVTIDRSLTEIVARRIVVLENGEKKS